MTDGRRLSLRSRIAEELTPELLDGIRWFAVFVWVCALGLQVRTNGVPFDREAVILWLMIGAFSFTIGRRAVWAVVVDWVPFALVLLAYDFARGASDTLGMPTWWSPPLSVDKALFGGTEPTVWLQEHLKYARAQWWDVLVCATYISFFLMPYVVAAILWIRSRTEFRRWTTRFVGLSLLGFALFALIPTAPPWAAARCSASQVANHPSAPTCMLRPTGADVSGGGLLGSMTQHRAGALPYIERLSGRGWSELHLTAAQSLLTKGQATSNLVAAVPSLHAAGVMLLLIFLWKRVRVGWRVLLVAYNILMAFSLVYAAEHYVSDVLAGWLCAIAVSFVASYVERRRAQGGLRLGRRGARRRVDTLGSPIPADARTTEPADAVMES